MIYHYYYFIVLLFYLIICIFVGYYTGFNRHWTSVYDQELTLVYNALLFNNGIEIELFQHPGYFTILLLSIFYKILFILNLLEVDKLSSLTSENFDNSLNQNKLSFDNKDFSLGFVRGLSLEDGAATLTEFTGRIIGAGLFSFLPSVKKKFWKILICGGGRKNKTLIEKINNAMPENFLIQSIDNYGIDGDYVESQAFAYLAIRSYLGLPISFPKTTGCKNPTTGGKIVKNF